MLNAHARGSTHLVLNVYVNTARRIESTKRLCVSLIWSVSSHVVWLFGRGTPKVGGGSVCDGTRYREKESEWVSASLQGEEGGDKSYCCSLLVELARCDKPNGVRRDYCVILNLCCYVARSNRMNSKHLTAISVLCTDKTDGKLSVVLWNKSLLTVSFWGHRRSIW